MDTEISFNDLLTWQVGCGPPFLALLSTNTRKEEEPITIMQHTTSDIKQAE